MKKILFFGTAQFSKDVLEALFISQKYEIIGVITNPDTRQGRKQIIIESAVKKYALEKNIPIFQFAKIDLQAVETIKKCPQIL